MRILFAVVLTSLVLMACGSDQGGSAQYEPASPELTSSTVDTAGPEDVVPGDVIEDSLKVIGDLAPLSVRYDRMSASKDGIKQRQVYVEMLGASADQVEAAASRTFEAAGFAVRRGLADQNGIRLQYKKPGVAPLNVLIRDKAASPPSKDPSATASLYIKQDAL